MAPARTSTWRHMHKRATQSLEPAGLDTSLAGKTRLHQLKRSEQADLNPGLPALAARLLFSVQDELFTSLADRGFADLRPRYGAVLAYIDPEGTRAGKLALMSGLHKQRMSVMIDELVSLGYVVREVDHADRRARLVVPTERGLAAMLEGEAIDADIERGHAAALGQADYSAFLAMMRTVTARQRVWHTRRDGNGLKTNRRYGELDQDLGTD